ncbi:hypothetical protein GIS00_15640 [Nakamurella sp. YIM 132087]|uniref:DUF1616 domain-containing protein n=1 Tax=Nakamurella alba TaxID=2665158 RepID=A0A7K1FMQ7_9ACTN|nr:hypothetical protein [Nakamurella alba]MTD15370.1 hypothetical protein [Nakamurella alba]
MARHLTAPEGGARIGLGPVLPRALAGLALLVVAGVLVLSGMPWQLRLPLALPAVIAVAGISVTVLVLGPRTPRAPDLADDAPPAVSADPLLRACATVMFGVIALLPPVLLMGLFGIRITDTSIAWGVLVFDLALLVAATARLAGARSEADVAVFPTRDVRRGFFVAGAVVAALALLVGATAVARSMEVQRVESYAQFTLGQPQLYASGELTAAPGAQVEVGWILRGYALDLPADPSVTVEVGGEPVQATTAPLDVPADTTGAQVTRSGEVLFAAPTEAGLYRVRLSVADPTGGTRELLLLLAVNV